MIVLSFLLKDGAITWNVDISLPSCVHIVWMEIQVLEVCCPPTHTPPNASAYHTLEEQQFLVLSQSVYQELIPH
jgi:hypothetical protein